MDYLLELLDASGELAFEWDSEKAASNLRKHGISFEEAVTIFQDDTLTIEDGASYDEMREISFGRLEGGLGSTVVVCVVHTDREDRIRIISARKATAQERKHFDVYYRKTHH
ncbi:BrnT family toxin [Rhizobium leguminosarum]|nr:BrnT family toxin [Rhizobium leguminosarum]NNH42886.1 BrnT family toxin [Rhizobium laguerreae]